MIAFRAVGLASCLLATSALAAEPFDCKTVTQGELRVYKGLAPPVSKGSVGDVKLKKGAIVIDEERALISDWFKPDGGIGGVIPYKQPQVVFSPYLVELKSLFCSSQRHGEVFGAEEVSQQYFLRCLIDTDGDQEFEGFRRFGELVSYNLRTGKTGVPTGALQADVPLARKFKLVAAEPPASNPMAFAPILRSVVWIVDLTKTSATFRERSQIEIPSFPTKLDTGAGKVRTSDVQIPLSDDAEALVGKTRIKLKRTGSGWTVAAPDGFENAAKLICGGTVLETGTAFTIFSAGGMATLVHHEDAHEP